MIIVSGAGSCAGIALLICGIVCIVFNDQLAAAIQRRQYRASLAETRALVDPEQKDRQQPQQSLDALGLVLAVCVGLCGGSILVPASLGRLQGFDAVLSLGTGACVTTAIPALTKLKELPSRAADVWPGVLAGVVLNISFVLSIYANSEVSFAVAQPILQTALVVSGLLGIFLFKEIQGSLRIVLFFVAAAVVLIGAAVLAVYGPVAGGAEPEPEPE